MKRRLWAFAVMLVLAVGLCPGLALAATSGDLQAADSNLATQDAKDLGQCTIKFTDKNHVCDDGADWQMYYAKGKKKAIVDPQFTLYHNGKAVPKSAYTVSYKLTYWNNKKEMDVERAWNSPLIPSASPDADTGSMSSEYKLVVTAKSGSGYTGSYENATICVVDSYNVGRNMCVYMAKAKESWRYNINPMNGHYYVIPQAQIEDVLDSVTLMTGCTPGDGVMQRNGTKVASKYYAVTYYKALKDAVEENRSPTLLNKVGKKLKSEPTTPGTYVMVVKGKSPYYGTFAVYFDIQGSIKDVAVSRIPAKTENGKYIEPGVKVTYNGEMLVEGVDYDVAYTNNLEAGTATATITGSKVLNNDQGSVDFVNKARYFTGSKKVKFTIKKNASKKWAANSMTVKANAVSVSAQALQEEGTQEVASSKAFTVKKAQGKVTFQKVSGSSLIEIAKNGEVHVVPHAAWYAHNLKNNTFNIKVKVLAKGNAKYYAKAQTVTLKVKVK